jgi:hypothetical protein
MQTSLTMTTSIASILIDSGDDRIFGFSLSALLWLAFGGIILFGVCWQLFDNWVERTHGRNWPTVSAVVDIVTVALMKDNGLPGKAYSSTSYYQATLTYIYYNPEQQMGDYSRRFGNEDDAKAWANSYKGETIKVHVDPRDPTRSVLRKEDI